MKNQLKYGIVLSYLTILLNNLVYLLFTPFLLKSLGQSSYGLYVLMGSLIGYIALLDLGLTNAIIRFITKERERTGGNENKLISQFLVIYIFISLLVSLVGTVIYFSLDNLFSNSLTVDELSLAKIIFVLLVFNLMITLPMNIFNSVIISSEKFIFNKSLGIARIITRISLLIIFLNLGYGVLALVVIDTIVNILVSVINLFYAIKVLKIKIIKTEIKFTFLKELFTYSSFIFMIMIADLINQKFGHIIIGIKLDTESVAIFGIAFAVIGMFTQISSAITNVFVPRITRLSIRDENLKVFNEFVQVSRVQLIIWGLVFGGYLAYGKSFIELWAGPGYSEVWLITLIILPPLAIDLIQNLGVQVLYAKNKHKFRALTMFITSILSIFVSFFLIDELGILGVAISTSLSYLIGNVVLTNFYYHFEMKINMISYYKKLFSGLWIPILGSFFLINSLSLNVDHSWFNLIMFLFIYILIYLLFLSFIGFTRAEKDFVRIYLIKFLPVK